MVAVSMGFSVFLYRVQWWTLETWQNKGTWHYTLYNADLHNLFIGNAAEFLIYVTTC